MKRFALIALVTLVTLVLGACTDAERNPGSGGGQGGQDASSPVTVQPTPAVTEGDLTTSVAGETPTVAVCPEGSNPDQPGPAEQTRPRSGPMAFDRQSGLIVLKESVAHGGSTTWTFDVCTNTWRQMSPDREPGDRVSEGSSGPMVYDADSDLTIMLLGESSVWAYDVETDTWTEERRSPLDDAGYSAIRPVYDPVSGLVVALKGPWMWTYDVDTDTWARLGPSDTQTPADHQLFAYDASVDRFIAFASGEFARTFDRRMSSWSPTYDDVPVFNTGYWASGGEAAYDEVAARTVVFSDGLVAAYDATADRWARLYGRSRCCPEGPFNRLLHWMVYDPVNARLVVYGGSSRGVDPDRGWTRTDDVWAFDLAAGEWIELLPRSKPPA